MRALSNLRDAAALVGLRTQKRRIQYALRRGIVSHMGVRLDLGLPAFDKMTKMAVFRGKYELNEALTLRKVVRTNDRVLEIGAGCGFITCFVANLRRNNEIRCIEGNPEMIPVIRHHLDLNEVKADVQNHFINYDASEATLFVPKSFYMASVYGESGRPIRLTAMPLANILAEWPPDLMIMDIEGSETILEKVRLPREIRAVVIEVHPTIIGLKAITAVMMALAEQGFVYLPDQSWKRILAFERR